MIVQTVQNRGLQCVNVTYVSPLNVNADGVSIMDYKMLLRRKERPKRGPSAVKTGKSRSSKKEPKREKFVTNLWDVK